MCVEAKVPSDRQPILQTEYLTRIVAGRHLVNDISIQIQPGQVVAVVGPSGAGKSSFLRLLNRLDEPTSGRVLLDGNDYTLLSPRELRRRVGMVMQTPHLFPGTVADNIRFGPLQHGETLATETVDRLLEQVGLDGFARREVSNLSGGESQRVSLARTLANSPDLLLLDEPTSSLDEASQRGVEELVCSIIHEQNLTCLIVTHDINQASRMASHAMILDAGRLLRFGPAEEVLGA